MILPAQFICLGTAVAKSRNGNRNILEIRSSPRTNKF